MADSPAQPKRGNPNAELAFADYVALGPGRSLAALAEIYRSRTESVPTKNLTTIKQWSIRYRWQERLAESASARSDQMLRDASELDAESFLISSRILNKHIKAEDSITIDEAIRVRESVRKPISKHGVAIDISVNVMQQAERIAAELGITPEDLLADAEEIAAHAWKVSS